MTARSSEGRTQWMHTRVRRNCGTTHRTVQKLASDGVPALRRRRYQMGSQH
ncbi:hypothetical protein LEMLEM_LOCUS6482 [Lemmus lemmus]